MSADAVHEAFLASLTTCREHEVELGQLDAVAGDGDHGSGMVRGFTAACAATAGLSGSAAASITAGGDAFADAAGGASGALWGVFLQGVGRELEGIDLSPAAVTAAMRKGQARIARLGKSQPGDKTLLDTLVPFLDALEASVSGGKSLPDSWDDALVVARQATQATASMVARRGRAAVLGERGLGTVDSGACSLLLVLEAVVGVISDSETEQE